MGERERQRDRDRDRETDRQRETERDALLKLLRKATVISFFLKNTYAFDINKDSNWHHSVADTIILKSGGHEGIESGTSGLLGSCAKRGLYICPTIQRNQQTRELISARTT